MKKADIIINDARGQAFPHLGYILLDVLGEAVKGVPCLVVPVTNFRRSTPRLLGTDFVLAVRNTMHDKYGKGCVKDKEIV